MYPSFYFIRHAESIHNQRATLVKNKLNLGKNDDISKIPLYRQVKYGDQYFDCGITEKGYEECLKARGECKDLDIGLVLVSPLNRAIVSANKVFQGHKNKPRFIVEPLLGERMTSACDLGAGLNKTMEDFPEYDYTQLVDNAIVETWYIQNLPLQRRTSIYKKIQQQGVTDTKDIGKIVLKQLQQKIFLQSKKQLQDRVKRLKVKLLDYMQQTDKKIAIVGHSNMIKTLTATGFKVDGQPINGVQMQNCQVDLINVVMDSISKEKSGNSILPFCK